MPDMQKLLAVLNEEEGTTLIESIALAGAIITLILWVWYAFDHAGSAHILSIARDGITHQVGIWNSAR